MIYTIGHEENYLSVAREYGKIIKLGKCGSCERFPNGYEGGYAFRTAEEAQERIEEAYHGMGFAVFGLEADWEIDTEPACGRLVALFGQRCQDNYFGEYGAMKLAFIKG
uniref:Uncharacterized protein n=1 Tax=viral metagenome TaxID=1070528 RepID=A0A6M3KUP0_9ZZZZ